MFPVVTRSGRVIHFGPNSTDSLSPRSSPFSPVSPSPQSPPTPTSLPSRAPIVHFFVSDHGNAKVKSLTDQFIELLTKNGISVYTERYVTHQPGFQVRAAALNSTADFFFQIHSKTAGPGHVRLYIAGQPKRMTMDEAIANIWSWWRLQCGSLTRDEVELLSREKTLFLLREFANLDSKDFDLEVIQTQAKAAMENGESCELVFDRIREFDAILQNGKARVLSTRIAGTDWVREPGLQLQRLLPAPRAVRLSQSMKELLVSIIEQTMTKVRSISELLQRYTAESPAIGELEETEIPIEGEGGSSSWRMLIESLDEDNVGSMRIASYGDSRQSPDLPQVNPMFLLDDY
jgi:hypothetical protein